MLKVTLLGADGAYLSRSEIVSLYASDLNYVPYMRRASVQYDGSVELEVPQAPVMLHAKLNIPGYGYGMWVMADNCGVGYAADAQVDFIREAASSRIHEVEALLSGEEFTPSVKCVSMLRDAQALLHL